jgi:hypothetical protein
LTIVVGSLYSIKDLKFRNDTLSLLFLNSFVEYNILSSVTKKAPFPWVKN